MNKFLGKSRPPKAPGYRSGSVRPQLETLECRAQPGSVWSATSSLGAAAALDLNAGIDITTPQVDQELVIQHRPASENSLPVQVHSAEPETSAPRETAPLEVVAHTAAPTFTNDPNGLTIADQARAVGVLPAAPAVPVRPAYALSQAPAASPTQAPSAAHPLIQGRNGTTYPVTVTAADFQTTTAAVLPQDLRLQPLARPKFLALDNQHVPPPGFSYNPIYSSYLGTPDGDSHVNGFRANPSGDGSAFATGFLTDPSTGAQDAYVARISADGSSDQPMLIVGDASGANNWQGAAVDVGSDGAIYVVGTVSAVDHSQSQMFFMRVASDVRTVDWTISPTLGGALDQGNGARIGFDPNLGECLYATGAFQNPNPNRLNTELAVVRVSNLGPDPTQLQVEGHGFQFRDPQHARANTPGNSIGVDSNGNMLIAASLGLHDGSDRTALVVGVPADFSTARGQEIPFNTNGPTNGSYNSVDVDANGEIYLAGQLIPQGGSHPGLLLSAFTFDGRTFTLIYSTLWQFGTGTADWVGTGNKAIGGGAGAQAINSTVHDPQDPMIGANVLLRVGPSGDRSLDNKLIGVIGGSNDDESTALDVQADPTGSGNDYYLAGYTNSPDFATTAKAFQPNDPGPSFYEGWVVDLQITPY